MVEELSRVIGNVMLMGGDLVTDMLAPSEIREIARSVIASGVIAGAPAVSIYPPHLAWMATIPPEFHCCFSS